MAHFTVFTVTVLMCIANVLSNDTSEFDCKTLLPKGKKSHETTDNPYKLTVSTKTFTPGESIEVTISGEKKKIKKFMVQARLAVLQTSIGKWKTPMAFTCSSDADSVFTNSMQSTNSLSLTWTAPADKQDSPIVFVASIMDAEGKVYLLQVGPILEAAKKAATTAAPVAEEQDEEEESQRRPNEEEEQPARPIETTTPKNNEDPNATERELERQRQESLRRDGQLPDQPAPTPVDREEQEGGAAGAHDEEDEDEENGRTREEEAEEEDEESRRERIQYEILKGEEEDARQNRIHMEMLKMEQDEEKEEMERLKRIRWEEEDERLHILKEQASKKVKNDAVDHSDEVSLNDDEFLIKDKLYPESGAMSVASSIASFLSLVVVAFFF